MHGVFPPQNAKTCCYNGMNSLNKLGYQKIPIISRERKQEKTPLISLYWPNISHFPEKARHKYSTHRRTEVTTSEAPSSPFLTNTAVLATVVTAVCTTACGCWTTCACGCGCGWAWACCTGGCWGGCWPAWGCWGCGPVCCWALCCSASACKAKSTFSLQACNKQDVVFLKQIKATDKTSLILTQKPFNSNERQPTKLPSLFKSKLHNLARFKLQAVLMTLWLRAQHNKELTIHKQGQVALSEQYKKQGYIMVKNKTTFLHVLVYFAKRSSSLLNGPVCDKGPTLGLGYLNTCTWTMRSCS